MKKALDRMRAIRSLEEADGSPKKGNAKGGAPKGENEDDNDEDDDESDS